MLRRLDQDEREWFGVLAIMTLIIGLSLSTVINLTEEPMDKWGKEITAQEKPDLVQAIIWLVVCLGRVLWVVFVIQPLFSLMQRLGFFIDKMPQRWIKYLGTKNKSMKYDN